MLDCLPAGPILRGAGEQLGRWSVIWCRVLLRPFDGMLEEATLGCVESLLVPLGYRCIQVSESNHPAVGEALFLRDWKAVLNPRLDGLRQDLAHLSETSAKQAEQHRSQTAALTQERDGLAEEVASLRERSTELTGRVEQQGKTINSRDTAIDQLIKVNEALEHTKDQQTQLAAKRLEQIEALKKEQTQQVQAIGECDQRLAAQTAEIAAVKQARDEQSKLAAERLKQVEVLQKELEASQHQGADQESRIEALNQAKTDLEQKHQAVAKTQAENAKALEEARETIGVLSTERDQLREQFNQGQSQVEELGKALETAKAETDKHAKLVAQYKTEADTQAKLAAERAEKLEQSEQSKAALQRDNAIALRMQVLREADLKDLQQRHAEVVAQKDKQSILLKQLTERLAAASSYLHQIKHDGHSMGDGASHDSQTRAAITAQDSGSPANSTTADHCSIQAGTNTAASSTTADGLVEPEQSP
ncbi:hypothetical protein [Thiorhodococcus fuscus]|uniref:KfrA N-terminal DNA-binding domain-containing protein n=1 Tax=Thiorhodococcus fuscus TaxID=527200 RepID=A0ABW4YE57_9GAMM